MVTRSKMRMLSWNAKWMLIHWSFWLIMYLCRISSPQQKISIHLLWHDLSIEIRWSEREKSSIITVQRQFKSQRCQMMIVSNKIAKTNRSGLYLRYKQRQGLSLTFSTALAVSSFIQFWWLTTTCFSLSGFFCSWCCYLLTSRTIETQTLTQRFKHAVWRIFPWVLDQLEGVSKSRDVSE